MGAEEEDKKEICIQVEQFVKSGEGLMWCAGETGEGGQRQALPGEVFPRRQLVHLGRDPGHSS